MGPDSHQTVHHGLFLPQLSTKFQLLFSLRSRSTDCFFFSFSLLIFCLLSRFLLLFSLFPSFSTPLLSLLCVLSSFSPFHCSHPLSFFPAHLFSLFSPLTFSLSPSLIFVLFLSRSRQLFFSFIFFCHSFVLPTPRSLVLAFLLCSLSLNFVLFLFSQHRSLSHFS